MIQLGTENYKKKKKDLFMAECKLRKFTISSMICDLENGGNVSTVL